MESIKRGTLYLIRDKSQAHNPLFQIFLDVVLTHFIPDRPMSKIQ